MWPPPQGGADWLIVVHNVLSFLESDDLLLLCGMVIINFLRFLICLHVYVHGLLYHHLHPIQAFARFLLHFLLQAAAVVSVNSVEESVHLH